MLKYGNYKEPDIDELKKELILRYKEIFLKENNLNVGDTITLPFPIQRITHEGRKAFKVSFDKDKLAILKEDENGFLYAESIEMLQTYRLITKPNRKGNFIEEYISEQKKGIIYIGKNIFKFK